MDELKETPKRRGKLQMSDEDVEKEIARLKESPYVKLAEREDYVRNRRRQYMYSLRSREKRGLRLAAEGVTMESLDALYAGTLDEENGYGEEIHP